jgi:bifunctional non-homologous end joining protein LigD
LRVSYTSSVPLPTIDPILPVLSRTLPTGKDWLYELKLDGFRGMLYLEDGRGFFRSKTKNRMRRFQDLADALARTMRVRDAILDGEIVVMGEAGPDFAALFRSTGTPQFAAFDLVHINGADLRELPLTKRKTMLRRVVKDSPITFVEALRDPSLYEATVRLDLEGVVAKRRGDAYAPTTQWIKVRHPEYSQKEGRGEMFHGSRRSAR